MLNWEVHISLALTIITVILFVWMIFFFLREQIAVTTETNEYRENQLLAAQLDRAFKNPEQRKQIIEDRITTACITSHSNSTSSDKSCILSGDAGCSEMLNKGGSICTASLDSSSSSRMSSIFFHGDHEMNCAYAENICSICLEFFSSGEEVAWSKELKCRHCFHSHCLTSWLMKHEDCPVCRTTFLNKNEFLNSLRVADSNDVSALTPKDETGDSSPTIDEEAGDSIDLSPFVMRNSQIISIGSKTKVSEESIKFPIQNLVENRICF